MVSPNDSSHIALVFKFKLFVSLYRKVYLSENKSEHLSLLRGVIRAIKLYDTDLSPIRKRDVFQEIMNKINIFALIIGALIFGACYQKGTISNVKPPTAPTNSTIAVEKSVEPSNTQSTKGDINQAMDYFRAKNYEKAASEFETIVKTDQKNQSAQLHLGRSYKALNKPNEAIAAYKKAVELKNTDAAANYELGKIYFDKKDYENSLPYIEKASKTNYTSVEYLLTLGDNYRELKRCNYAVVPYGKVNGFDDKNTAAYYGMGLCYIELKNRIAAGQQVRNLEKLDKNLAKKLEDQIRN